MKNLAKVIALLNKMPQTDLNALATGLVWFDECTAERLKNSIAIAQQERDMAAQAQWALENQQQVRV
jgi:hypothetical protein